MPSATRIALLLPALLLLYGGIAALRAGTDDRVVHPDVNKARDRIARIESGERPLDTAEAVRLLRADADYIEAEAALAETYRQGLRLFGMLMLGGAATQVVLWWAARRTATSAPPA